MGSRPPYQRTITLTLSVQGARHAAWLVELAHSWLISAVRVVPKVVVCKAEQTGAGQSRQQRWLATLRNGLASGRQLRARAAVAAAFAGAAAQSGLFAARV